MFSLDIKSRVQLFLPFNMFEMPFQPHLYLAMAHYLFFFHICNDILSPLAGLRVFSLALNFSSLTRIYLNEVLFLFTLILTEIL